jgi:signal transduction histidine kinase
VRDDGVGIAPATLSQVTAPSHAAGAPAAGSGLGLSVVRNIVGGTLGGRIEIVSPPQAGTTVTVTLPRTAP